jgi:putative ABC transport system permease protein
MLQNYLKIALRNLLKNRVYSFINILGLAIGMAVVLLISLFIYDEYSYDRFNKNFDSIYRLTEFQKQEDGFHLVAVTPGLLANALKKDFAEIEQTLRIGQQGGLIQNDDKRLETNNILVVDPTLFSIFDFPLAKGSTHKLFENPDEVVLTEKSAAILFGKDWAKQEVIGKMVTLQSFQKFPLKVVGIAKNLPANTHIQAEVFLPFKLLEKYDEWSMKWNSNSFHTYIKLSKKTNIQNFEGKLMGVLKKYKDDADTKVYLQPLSDVYLKSKFDFQTDWGKRSDIFYVYLFITVGLIVLSIAVFNFVNLATARATQRAKEVGVRKIVGAGKSNLILQFLTEALFIVSIATFLAIILTDLALPTLNQLSNKSLFIPFIQPLFWVLVGIFIVLMTILSGLYPSFILSSYSPTKVLKGIFIINSGKNLRNSLVVGQFSFSMILIVCTITVYNQLTYIQNKNLGFDKEHLMYFRLKGDLKEKSMMLKNEISKLSSIESASVTTNSLVDVSNSSGIEWEGQIQKTNFLITQINTDPDFIRTIGAKMISGRNFSNQFARDTSDKIGTYLLNETAVHKMGWTAQSALGKKVKFWGFEGEVVGVVKDFHFQPLNFKIEPFIFRYRPKEFYFNLLVKTKPSNLKRAIEGISNIYKKYEANYPISYGFVNQDLEKQYTNDRRTGSIVLIFSVLAIIISCMGLFGLVTFTATQRIKEIGIRKVLGASVIQIVRLLSKDFLRLVILGIVIASPIAYWAMDKWLQDFAYRVDISWWIFALAGIVAIVIALLTVSYQSIKAALANPVKSLRTE